MTKHNVNMKPTARTKTLLNGTWQLEPSNDDIAPSRWSHLVPVPALVDVANPRHGWRNFKYHWHRTTFTVPERSELAFIIIEQAMFGTEVWLNGVHLGGDIACYTSQEYDARNALREGENELLVRVGKRENLPPHSAVGKDQERSEWIPGIWGDVYLLHCDNPRIKFIQVIPHIENATAEARVTVENLSADLATVVLSTFVSEKNSGVRVGNDLSQHFTIEPNSAAVGVVRYHVDGMQVWSPETPFLYELHAVVRKVEPQTLNPEPRGDACAVVFGMREFTIVDGDFFLNGKKILLRGGNIAFHRFLSDADRRTLPWEPDWIKKALIDIPKAHRFNFFRCHLGHMYNRWYDIADEHGMLLQDEWMFWTTTGSKEQIKKEFTRWLQDNWNHPSIIIWDPLNECTNDVVQKEIVPQMKMLDPTRPWESVDFVEEHPYIYSLGPVLNDQKFGFTRSMEEIENSSRPSMLNEFLWWWLDKDFNPTPLMKGVIERWLGPQYSEKDLVDRQSFLAQELVELFRRMRVDAIQPFVYLSNNGGPTAHWFIGDIATLQPKPILKTLKNAFAPFGLSIELWDRHFFPGERRKLRIFVFNDYLEPRRGKLRYGIVDVFGNWCSSATDEMSVDGNGCKIIEVDIRFSAGIGQYFVQAELTDAGSGGEVVCSKKVAHVYPQPDVADELHEIRVALYDEGEENRAFLRSCGIPVEDVHQSLLGEYGVLLVGEKMVRTSEYSAMVDSLTAFVRTGKSIIILEPEFGVEDKTTVTAAEGLHLDIERRADLDKGGYDSYVFAEDHGHPVWNGIAKEHLQMFNGAFGGEMVSQHDVTARAPHIVIARCGLHLRTLAAAEVTLGRGRIILSRIQTRGRLVSSKTVTSLYDRRADPVAQQYFLNLVKYASSKEG